MAGSGKGEQTKYLWSHPVRGIKRLVRPMLERRFGATRVNTWASRIPYSRVTYCLVAFEIAPPEDAERRIEQSGFILREGSSADIDLLEGQPLYGNTRQYREWLEEGQRFVVAEEQGRPVSYVWLDFSPSVMLEDLPEYRVELSPEAYYGHEAWTLPSHRGRSLRRLTFLAELLLARRHGKRWRVSYQWREESLNELLRNLARTGNPPGMVIAEVNVVQFAGFRFVWRKRLAHQHPAARFVAMAR
jgi:hypothetical protein